MTTNLQTAITYSNDCIENIIPSGHFIISACKQFLLDINEDSQYFYDQDEVDTLVDFCQSFDLTEVLPPTLTILQPWQIWVLANCYGIKNKESLKRKYSLANISVSRGNGKTQLVALLCIYELLYGHDAQIILAAGTNKTVIEIDFDKIKKLLYQIDPDQQRIKILYNKVIYKTNKIICTSDQSKPFDGMSGSLMLCDEMHTFFQKNIYGTLRSSLAKRSDSILFIISTSGLRTDTEYYQLCEYSKKVLNHEIHDNSLFSALYYVDDIDIENDSIYTSEDVLRKANPNLGISVQRDIILSELQVAKHSASERNSILTKHLNIWANKSNQDAFILDKYLKESWSDLTIDDPIFKGCNICLGADLSVNDDISAISMMIIKDGTYYFFNYYYICSEALTTKKNKDRYKDAAKLGFINIIEGRAINYDIIIADIKARNTVNPIRLIAFDKYNAQDFFKKLTNKYNLVRISQLGSGLNAPLREMQRLFMLSRIKVQRNPITEWMFENVVTLQGKTGLMMLDKSNSESNKIDGIAAMTDSLAGFLISPEYGFGIF